MAYTFTTDELNQKTPKEIAEIIQAWQDDNKTSIMDTWNLFISIKEWLLVIDQKIKN